MTTSSEANRPAIALAAVSILFAYGCAIGALYLRAYWGSFGIDPFQFATATDLAITGLAGVSIILLLIIVAGVIGEVAGSATIQLARKCQWAPVIIGVLILAFMVCMVLFVTFGWIVVFAMLATWGLQALAWNSALLKPIMNSVHAPMIVAALVYPPIATHFYAKRTANEIRADGSFVDVRMSQSGATGPQLDSRFVGRIGDTYFISDADASLTLIPATSVKQIRLLPQKATPAQTTEKR